MGGAVASPPYRRYLDRIGSARPDQVQGNKKGMSMARKKVAIAKRALSAAFGDFDAMPADQRGWAIQRLLCGLRHLASEESLSFDALDAGAARHHLQDVCAADNCKPDLRYSGWDRRHDDNKAEGRPIGNQWSSEGSDYSLGFKVHRRRK